MRMDGSVLEEKSSFKMLGLTFPFKLNWGSCIISAKSVQENWSLDSFFEVSFHIFQVSIGCSVSL